MRVRSRIVRLLGLLAVLWLAGVPASLYAQAATPTPAPVLTGRRVVKEVCRSLLGYDSVEALKRDLEIVAKREAANELFGELIVASITVQNWTVTEDQLRSQSLGLVRVEGSPVIANGVIPGDVCVTLTAYATARDFARFEPMTVNGRACVSGADLTLRQAQALADEKARLQALLAYDPRLAQHDAATVLPLLRQIILLEGNVPANTDNYCVTVQGNVIPIEVEGFLAMDGTLLVLPDATPALDAAAVHTPDLTATAAVEGDSQATATAADVTRQAILSATATPTPRPRATATASRAPSPTLRPTATHTRTPAPAATATPVPQEPVPPAAATRSALLTLQAQIWATQTALAASPHIPTMTPRSAAPATVRVELLAPADGVTTGERLDFAWTPVDLPAGHAYELVFWCCDVDGAMTHGRGYAGGYTTQAAGSLNFAAGGLSFGEYKWAILLVRQAPYERIRQISDVRSVYFADPTQVRTGGGGGGGDERP